MKTIKPWNELSRAEKIKSLFDYPDEMRDSQAKGLWGPDAYAYSNHIWFPIDAPWNEIVEVIKHSHGSHAVYVRLTYKDFKSFDSDYTVRGFERGKDRTSGHEYVAFAKWRKKILRSSRPEPLDLELFDENRIVCRVCTEEGDRGDEYGFGVEPDVWASALFDLDGNIIRPFAPGYLSGPRDEY